MSPELQLSDLELETLDMLLKQDLESSRVEFHHTRSLDYRDFVKRHIEVVEVLLEKVRHTMSEK